ncbi:propionate catabolism operon regulatory protein PrpR [Diaphorobacter sp. HDW4A]|uniref:propionate catabolism operon regulatory protein PrpR n=1 Tax=Diaphorobacter sp. HDW4A TaxID=2714924 RepID=UPI001408073E|nr:propionate catabolism operon regulatory protein PrpR [Diaphorobacter sp. HDW4A]QIL80405.1 propionate catabolism operon regulatory protein PrpR [Diaphorobacter sp. HDW4A]
MNEKKLPHIVTVGRHRIGHVIQDVARSWSGAARVTHISASFEDAVRAVLALDEKRAIDALVVAGASGAHVRERVEIPVAMVEVRGLGLLEALMTAKQQTTPERPRVGLVSFDVPSVQLTQFDALFGLGVAQFVYHGAEDAADCVRQLLAAKVGAVVAPGLVADLAQQAGIPSVLLYSEAAVRQALDDALLLARHRLAERDRHQWLETVLGELQDGVVAIDTQGRIRALNQPMADLLGAPMASLHGQLLSQIAPALMQGQPLRLHESSEEVVHIATRTAMRMLVLRRAPLIEGGVAAGSLLICRDPAVIQRADRSLRANQRQRGAGVRWSLDEFLGSSAVVVRARQLALQYAVSDSTVLILGESGTGKEMIAQGIHRASRRAAQPFLAVNCAALAESLLEAELFGYDEGAFTGARRGGKTGLVEAAHTGTLFLDEIGDMPLALQSRLLRVLQEREVMRVGSTTPVPVDVRVIAATHADLAALVERGEFRRDLYYRLAVLRLRTPSLVEHGTADVAEMAQAMLSRHIEMGKIQRAEAAELQKLLRRLLTMADAHVWPGNVRELDNWIERLVACREFLREGLDETGDARLREVFPECDVARIHPQEPPKQQQARLKETRQQAERERVREVLESVQGDQTRACEILGVSRATLWRRLKQG